MSPKRAAPLVGPETKAGTGAVPRQRPARKWLGTEVGSTTASFDLGSELELAGAIRKGLPTRAIEEIIDSGALDPADIYELVIPRRTLAHRKEKGQRLRPDESDRLARVLRALARAERALGDDERASHWLRTENRALEGNRPIDLLASDAGARAVEKVLGRIEHGIHS
jgi:putative toxin-antitoxin system antitoxin component (TIGR02293 family)